MTKLYFAAANSMHINRDTFGRWDWDARPLNILCAFRPLEGFTSWKNRVYSTTGARTILDSGAFSAWKSGTPVDLEELIAEGCNNEEWHEVAALDPIGDPVASCHNAYRMKLCGIPVIPVFHYGEDWGLLKDYKDMYDGRVGLGGIATGIGMREKEKWLDQCFARAYPARFHGFGVASESLLMKFPFYSVDTASWHTAARFGRSAATPDLVQPKKSTMDGTKFDGTGYDFRFEILHYLELEAQVQERWKSELEKISQGV